MPRLPVDLGLRRQRQRVLSAVASLAVALTFARFGLSRRHADEPADLR